MPIRMLMRDLESVRNFNGHIENKWLVKITAVTYATKVVIYRKLCKIEASILQTI